MKLNNQKRIAADVLKKGIKKIKFKTDRLSDIKGDIMDIDGVDIDVYYDINNIRCNGEHWWINAESQDIKNIRKTLDLPEDPYYGLHLTIGYATGLNLDICEYSRIYSLNRDKLKYYDL